jgi:hypothetical protein
MLTPRLSFHFSPPHLSRVQERFRERKMVLTTTALRADDQLTII